MLQRSTPSACATDVSIMIGAGTRLFDDVLGQAEAALTGHLRIDQNEIETLFRPFFDRLNTSMAVRLLWTIVGRIRQL